MKISDYVTLNRLRSLYQKSPFIYRISINWFGGIHLYQQDIKPR
jgi:hypothetical protein